MGRSWGQKPPEYLDRTPVVLLRANIMVAQHEEYSSLKRITLGVSMASQRVLAAAFPCTGKAVQGVGNGAE